MKGQLLYSLIMTALGLFTLMIMIPFLDSYIEDEVTTLNASPNSWTPFLVGVIRLFPAAILIGIIIVAVIQFSPRREEYR